MIKYSKHFLKPLLIVQEWIGERFRKFFEATNIHYKYFIVVAVVMVDSIVVVSLHTILTFPELKLCVCVFFIPFEMRAKTEKKEYMFYNMNAINMFLSIPFGGERQSMCECVSLVLNFSIWDWFSCFYSMGARK